MIAFCALLERPELDRLANSRSKKTKICRAQRAGATNLVCNQAADRKRETSRVRKALT